MKIFWHFNPIKQTENYFVSERFIIFFFQILLLRIHKNPRTNVLKLLHTGQNNPSDPDILGGSQQQPALQQKWLSVVNARLILKRVYSFIKVKFAPERKEKTRQFGFFALDNLHQPLLTESPLSLWLMKVWPKLKGPPKY